MHRSHDRWHPIFFCAAGQFRSLEPDHSTYGFRKDVMNKKLFGLVVVFQLLLAGCATSSHFGVPDRAASVPQWVPDTEAAIARAEASPGARVCPDKVAKAKELAKKGMETYWACRDAEAQQLMAEARKLAADAEACTAPAAARAAAGVHSVYFGFNQATLTSAARVTLDKAVKALQENPSATFELVGSTDSVGGDAYNMALGQRRAAAVKEYLVSRGIGASRLSTESVGESKPAASNATEQGRAENRRVDLVIRK